MVLCGLSGQCYLIFLASDALGPPDPLLIAEYTDG